MSEAPEKPGTTRIVPAREYRGDLLELLVDMRRALKARGESLPPSWPEESLEEVRAGRLLGWVLLPQGEERGLAILAVRNGRAFGQVHLEGPPEGRRGGMELLQVVVRERPSGLRRMDLALSCERSETEEAWGRAIDAAGPSLAYTVVRRRAMVRALSSDSPPPSVELPKEFRFVPALALGAGLLASVDFPAFAGGPDAAMVAETPEDNERLLRGLMDGDLGAPLREASPAVLMEEPDTDGGPRGHLVAFALCLEENPHSALVADIAVLPRFRGRGIGSALLARSLRGLVALGFTEARLWVTEANQGALRIYERAGFTTERVGRVLRWTAAGPTS